MIPEGRVSGWDMFKASFERFDPNFTCTKSAAVNASVMSLWGAALGFLFTSSIKTGCLTGGAATFTAVLVGSHCSCVYRKQMKILQEAENESS